MKISIFGLGYVGAVSLACLARDGHEVIGVDIDADKLDMIRAGRTPVVEEGMLDLMASVVAGGRVTVTQDVSWAIEHSELSFICVGTPSAGNGSQDLSAITRITGAIGQALAGLERSHVLVYRSTVTPGTTEGVIRSALENASGKRDGGEFHLCFQPEFLREGSSIRDYDHPPFTIVGAGSPEAVLSLRTLFEHLPCEFHQTSIRAAEAMKFCCNNFHAVKITFANEVARLCHSLAVDPFEVMSLVCRDTHLNISPAYLQPGFAFGGSCLPKDLRATMHLARSHDVRLPMLEHVLESNREHVELAVQKVLAGGRRRVALLGLSFKPGTDDLRESPLVELAERLIGKGIDLVIHDSGVKLSYLMGANRRFIQDRLPHLGRLLVDEIDAAIHGSELIIVGTREASVRDALARCVQPEQRVLDLINLRDPGRLPAPVDGLSWPIPEAV